MEIRKIQNDSLSSVISLFCDCFFDDHYYGKLFPNPATRKKEMSAKFSQDVLFCLEKGLCFGVFDSEKLIAFILTFDYNNTKQSHKTDFERIFGDSTSSSEKMHEKINMLSEKTIFCVSIAVYAVWNLFFKHSKSLVNRQKKGRLQK